LPRIVIVEGINGGPIRAGNGDPDNRIVIDELPLEPEAVNLWDEGAHSIRSDLRATRNNAIEDLANVAAWDCRGRAVLPLRQQIRVELPLILFPAALVLLAAS
jgi:hypothetical protein